MKITVDQKEFDVEQFSDGVKQLIAIMNTWQSQLADERLAVAKTEAALRSLNQELSAAIKAEVEKLNGDTPPEIEITQ